MNTRDSHPPPAFSADVQAAPSLRPVPAAKTSGPEHIPIQPQALAWFVQLSGCRLTTGIASHGAAVRKAGTADSEPE
jgi:hypothetical protein